MASTYIDSKGYRRFSDSGIAVHRWSASKKVGGTLYPNQRVHHKNRNKSDNRPSNLWIFNHKKHIVQHIRKTRKNLVFGKVFIAWKN